MFIRHFWLFDKYGNGGIEKAKVLDIIFKDPATKKTFDGCNLAVNAARLIFQDKQEREIMSRILLTNSHMISTSMRLKAVAIYEQLLLREVQDGKS